MITYTLNYSGLERDLIAFEQIIDNEDEIEPIASPVDSHVRFNRHIKIKTLYNEGSTII